MAQLVVLYKTPKSADDFDNIEVSVMADGKHYRSVVW
jgi:hypothetical protein